MFGYALEAEAVHTRLYVLAPEAAKQGKDSIESEFHPCPVSGNIEFGKPTEPCKVCGAKADKFILVS